MALGRLDLPVFAAVAFDDAVVNFGGIGPAMAVVEGGDRLGQDFPDKVLADGVLRLPTAPDELLEVAAVAELHDDVDFGSLLVDYAVVVLHDVRVVQLPQDVHFRHDLLLLLLAHDSVVELLPHEHFLIAGSAHFLNFAKGACNREMNKILELCRRRILSRSRKPAGGSGEAEPQNQPCSPKIASRLPTRPIHLPCPISAITSYNFSCICF